MAFHLDFGYNVNKVVKKMVELNGLKELWCQHHIAAVWLFGSRARGDAREDSDIDLAVLFKPPFPSAKTKGELISDLTHILKTDNVDLVFLHEAPLVLQKEIIYEGKIIYEADWDFRTDFEERVIRRWLDFEPFWNRMTRDLVETLKDEYGSGK